MSKLVERFKQWRTDTELKYETASAQKALPALQHVLHQWSKSKLALPKNPRIPLGDSALVSDVYQAGEVLVKDEVRHKDVNEVLVDDNTEWVHDLFNRATGTDEVRITADIVKPGRIIALFIPNPEPDKQSGRDVPGYDITLVTRRSDGGILKLTSPEELSLIVDEHTINMMPLGLDIDIATGSIKLELGRLVEPFEPKIGTNGVPELVELKPRENEQIQLWRGRSFRHLPDLDVESKVDLSELPAKMDEEYRSEVNRTVLYRLYLEDKDEADGCRKLHIPKFSFGSNSV